MNTVQRFNANGNCLKCGGEDVATRYYPDAHCETKACRVYQSLRMSDRCCEAEHLHRRCIRCGYTWPEATEDTPNDSPLLGEDQ